MKNPNGYGTIKKLSGARRRPFVFMISVNGKQKAMGYFATKLEAMAYQVDYNQSHGLHRLSKITFAELYARWMPKHISYASVSKSTINGYECAYKHCASLYDLPIADIKYSHLQAVIDDMTNLSYASKKKVRNLLSLLFAHAREMEYTTRDFTGLIKIGKNHPVNPHQAISKRKVNQLWKIVDTPDVDIILILIYTGMRNGELRNLLKSDINKKQKYINIRKSKTAAGVRIIPIHSKIWPLIEIRLSSPGAYLICTEDGRPYTYTKLSRVFSRIMKAINGQKHKLHDTRHTCATWLDNAEVNDNARKMILGHARHDVTNGVYTHKNLRQLRKAIEKI